MAIKTHFRIHKYYYKTLQNIGPLETTSNIQQMLKAFGKFFRRNLFIKTEPTPNPNSLIYKPENRPILGNESSREFILLIYCMFY